LKQTAVTDKFGNLTSKNCQCSLHLSPGRCTSSSNTSNSAVASTWDSQLCSHIMATQRPEWITAFGEHYRKESTKRQHRTWQSCSRGLQARELASSMIGVHKEIDEWWRRLDACVRV